MKPENLKCPDCGGPMVSRLNKKDNTRFWGCKAYPRCYGTRDVEGRSKMEKAAEREEKPEIQDDVFYGDPGDEY